MKIPHAKARQVPRANKRCKPKRLQKKILSASQSIAPLPTTQKRKFSSSPAITDLHPLHETRLNVSTPAPPFSSIHPHVSLKLHPSLKMKAPVAFLPLTPPPTLLKRFFARRASISDTIPPFDIQSTTTTDSPKRRIRRTKVQMDILRGKAPLDPPEQRQQTQAASHQLHRTKSKKQLQLMMNLQYVHADMQDTSSVPLETVNFINVYKYFKFLGLRDSEIIIIAQKCPKLFELDPDREIKPKIVFLLNLRWTQQRINYVLIKQPLWFFQNLHSMAFKCQYLLNLGFKVYELPYLLAGSWSTMSTRDIDARVRWLRSFHMSETDIRDSLRASTRLFTIPPRMLERGISVLVRAGFPSAIITSILRRAPQAIQISSLQLSMLSKSFENLLGVSSDQFYSSYIGRWPHLSYVTPNNTYRLFSFLHSVGFPTATIRAFLRHQGTCLSLDISEAAKKIDFLAKELFIPLALPYDRREFQLAATQVLSHVKPMHVSLANALNIMGVRGNALSIAPTLNERPMKHEITDLGEFYRLQMLHLTQHSTQGRFLRPVVTGNNEIALSQGSLPPLQLFASQLKVLREAEIDDPKLREFPPVDPEYFEDSFAAVEKICANLSQRTLRQDRLFLASKVKQISSLDYETLLNADFVSNENVDRVAFELLEDELIAAYHLTPPINLIPSHDDKDGIVSSYTTDGQDIVAVLTNHVRVPLKVSLSTIGYKELFLSVSQLLQDAMPHFNTSPFTRSHTLHTRQGQFRARLTSKLLTDFISNNIPELLHKVLKQQGYIDNDNNINGNNSQAEGENDDENGSVNNTMRNNTFSQLSYLSFNPKIIDSYQFANASPSSNLDDIDLFDETTQNTYIKRTIPNELKPQFNIHLSQFPTEDELNQVYKYQTHHMRHLHRTQLLQKRLNKVRRIEYDHNSLTNLHNVDDLDGNDTKFIRNKSSKKTKKSGKTFNDGLIALDNDISSDEFYEDVSSSDTESILASNTSNKLKKSKNHDDASINESDYDIENISDVPQSLFNKIQQHNYKQYRDMLQPKHKKRLTRHQNMNHTEATDDESYELSEYDVDDDNDDDDDFIANNNKPHDLIHNNVDLWLNPPQSASKEITSTPASLSTQDYATLSRFMKYFRRRNKHKSKYEPLFVSTLQNTPRKVLNNEDIPAFYATAPQDPFHTTNLFYPNLPGLPSRLSLSHHTINNRYHVVSQQYDDTLNKQYPNYHPSLDHLIGDTDLLNPIHVYKINDDLPQPLELHPLKYRDFLRFPRKTHEWFESFHQHRIAQQLPKQKGAEKKTKTKQSNEDSDDETTDTLNRNWDLMYNGRVKVYPTLFQANRTPIHSHLLDVHLPRARVDDTRMSFITELTHHINEHLALLTRLRLILQDRQDYLETRQGGPGKGGIQFLADIRYFFSHLSRVEWTLQKVLHVAQQPDFNIAVAHNNNNYRSLLRSLLGPKRYDYYLSQLPDYCYFSDFTKSKSWFLLYDQYNNLATKLSTLHAFYGAWSSVASRLAGLHPFRTTQLFSLRNSQQDTPVSGRTSSGTLSGGTSAGGRRTELSDISMVASTSSFNFLNIIPGSPHATALNQVTKYNTTITASLPSRFLPRSANELLRALGYALDPRQTLWDSADRGVKPINTESMDVKRHLTSKKAIGDAEYLDELRLEAERGVRESLTKMTSTVAKLDDHITSVVDTLDSLLDEPNKSDLSNEMGLSPQNIGFSAEEQNADNAVIDNPTPKKRGRKPKNAIVDGPSTAAFTDSYNKKVGTSPSLDNPLMQAHHDAQAVSQQQHDEMRLYRPQLQPLDEWCAETQHWAIKKNPFLVPPREVINQLNLQNDSLVLEVDPDTGESHIFVYWHDKETFQSNIRKTNIASADRPPRFFSPGSVKLDVEDPFFRDSSSLWPTTYRDFISRQNFVQKYRPDVPITPHLRHDLFRDSASISKAAKSGETRSSALMEKSSSSNPLRQVDFAIQKKSTLDDLNTTTTQVQTLSPHNDSGNEYPYSINPDQQLLENPSDSQSSSLTTINQHSKSSDLVITGKLPTEYTHHPTKGGLQSEVFHPSSPIPVWYRLEFPEVSAQTIAAALMNASRDPENPTLHVHNPSCHKNPANQHKMDSSKSNDIDWAKIVKRNQYLHMKTLRDAGLPYQHLHPKAHRTTNITSTQDYSAHVINPDDLDDFDKLGSEINVSIEDLFSAIGFDPHNDHNTTGAKSITVDNYTTPESSNANQPPQRKTKIYKQVCWCCAMQMGVGWWNHAPGNTQEYAATRRALYYYNAPNVDVDSVVSQLPPTNEYVTQARDSVGPDYISPEERFDDTGRGNVKSSLVMSFGVKQTWFDSSPSTADLAIISDPSYWRQDRCQPQLFVAMQRDIRASTFTLHRSASLDWNPDPFPQDPNEPVPGTAPSQKDGKITVKGKKDPKEKDGPKSAPLDDFNYDYDYEGALYDSELSENTEHAKSREKRMVLNGGNEDGLIDDDLITLLNGSDGDEDFSSHKMLLDQILGGEDLSNPNSGYHNLRGFEPFGDDTESHEYGSEEYEATPKNVPKKNTKSTKVLMMDNESDMDDFESYLKKQVSKKPVSPKKAASPRKKAVPK